MQKLVLRLDVHNDMQCKRKALKLVSSIPGIESISMDTEKKELMVIGCMDPVVVVKKLRKNYNTDIVSVGPAKEPEKPKEEPKPVVQVTDFVPVMDCYNAHYNCYYNYPFYFRYNDY